MSFVYIKSDPGLWTVGFYKPDGKWEPESDHSSEGAAAQHCRWLNGATAVAAPEQHDLLIEALDLVPRMSEDDPIAPALAEWCRKARAVVAKARGAA